MVEFPFPPNLLVSNPDLEGQKPGSLFIANSDSIKKEEEEDDNFSYINTRKTIDVYNNGYLVLNLREKMDFMDKMQPPSMQPPASCPPRCQVKENDCMPSASFSNKNFHRPSHTPSFLTSLFIRSLFIVSLDSIYSSTIMVSVISTPSASKISLTFLAFKLSNFYDLW